MKLELSSSDISKPMLSDELVAKAIDIFLKEGALWMNSVIPLDLLKLANKEIQQYILIYLTYLLVFYKIFPKR